MGGHGSQPQQCLITSIRPQTAELFQHMEKMATHQEEDAPELRKSSSCSAVLSTPSDSSADWMNIVTNRFPFGQSIQPPSPTTEEEHGGEHGQHVRT